jgi:hypothetical protein
MKREYALYAVIAVLLASNAYLLVQLGAQGGQVGADEPAAPQAADGHDHAHNETDGTDAFTEPVPVIDAYHAGEKVWFIHTDVSSLEMAKRLTTMVEYPSYHVPENSEVVNASKLSNIYVFTNGVNRSDAEPWGGGPFHYQIDIIDTVPGDDGYTSLRNPHLVTWKENATPRVLKSVEALKEAESNGELTIKQTDVVVNAPVVRFPGRERLTSELKG